MPKEKLFMHGMVEESGDVDKVLERQALHARALEEVRGWLPSQRDVVRMGAGDEGAVSESAHIGNEWFR